MSSIVVYNGISGSDTVKGTSSDDTIVSHRNNATLYGYAGDDSFDLRAEENVVYAGNGNDDVLVWEWAPYTTVDGGAGNDDIEIKASNVTVNGGAGDDYITVNNLSREIKSVTVTGGGGNNVFAFDRYTGTDRSMGFVISDLHNGDTIRSIKADNIEIESSAVNGNIVLTEAGKSEVNITLKGVSDISQVSNVVFRTKGGSKTLGEIFSESEPDPEPTPTIQPQPVTTDPEPTPTVQPQPVTPDPEPTPTVQPQPVTPDPEPTPTVQPQPVTPDPEPTPTIQPQPVTPTVQTNPPSTNGNHIYSGGNKTITNYQQGEKIRLNSDYRGINLNGNSFYVNSSSGSLEIKNARDKFITYSSGNDDNIVAYSYLASGGGRVDGRNYYKAEIMIGADNANNQIYAGSGGSSLWGGVGGLDTLTGSSGYDEFFYAVGGGDDVIQNAANNDLVNLASVRLSQITNVNVNIGEVTINFVDGGKLKVQGDSSVRYQIAEGTFGVNQYNKVWSNR